MGHRFKAFWEKEANWKGKVCFLPRKTRPRGDPSCGVGGWVVTEASHPPLSWLMGPKCSPRWPHSCGSSFNPSKAAVVGVFQNTKLWLHQPQPTGGKRGRQDPPQQPDSRALTSNLVLTISREASRHPWGEGWDRRKALKKIPKPSFYTEAWSTSVLLDSTVCLGSIFRFGTKLEGGGGIPHVALRHCDWNPVPGILTKDDLLMLNIRDN